MEKLEINVKIGAKLSELRKSHRLTLDNLGTLSRLDQKLLWTYESGKVSIPVNKLIQVLSVYENITVGQFLDDIIREIKEENK